jgi:protein-S-isoprenylcysteine O-methyltransferase Ste14
MQVYQGPQLWHWPGMWHWFADGLAILAIIGFLWTLTEYDGKEFLGLSQLRANCTSVNDLEEFHISTPHRFVRHPWYFFALVILWTRDINVTQFVSYSFMSLYFVFGSMLEEKKLLQYHGDKYRQYCGFVPRLFPVPWRYLTLTKAKKLLN